jgi:hypothetical protein
MSYAYQRANYGDYYRAGSIFGKIGGAIVGGVKGFITGGPVGAIGGATAALFPGKPAAAQTATRQIPPPASGISVQPGIGTMPAPGISGVAQRLVPGGQTGYVPAPAGQNGCPPGYHRNKALVRYERAIAQGKNVQAPNVKSVCVRHRSMNALNAKALRRGIRRTGGAVGLMKEALKGSGYTFKRTTAPTRRKKRKH